MNAAELLLSGRSDAVAALVRDNAPTLFFSVPPLCQRLTQAKVFLPSVRHFVSARETCPPALCSAWEQGHGQAIVNGYGATEAPAPMPLTHQPH